MTGKIKNVPLLDDHHITLKGTKERQGKKMDVVEKYHDSPISNQGEIDTLLENMLCKNAAHYKDQSQESPYSLYVDSKLINRLILLRIFSSRMTLYSVF